MSIPLNQLGDAILYLLRWVSQRVRSDQSLLCVGGPMSGRIYSFPGREFQVPVQEDLMLAPPMMSVVRPAKTTRYLYKEIVVDRWGEVAVAIAWCWEGVSEEHLEIEFTQSKLKMLREHWRKTRAGQAQTQRGREGARRGPSDRPGP